MTKDRDRDLTGIAPERREAATAIYAFAEAFKDVPLEELEREVAKAIAEVKEEKLHDTRNGRDSS